MCLWREYELDVIKTKQCHKTVRPHPQQGEPKALKVINILT